jgi:riboflavin transporter FmnP
MRNQNVKTNKTRALALVIIFVALAVALNVYGPKIPYPFAPFLFFQLWEIPIIVAFLLIGPKTGISVGVINTLILFAVFPGELPSGPLYNLTAVLSMMLGIYLPYRLATRGCKSESLSKYLRKHVAVLTTSATALGATMRVLMMTIVNYFALQQSFPIGYGLNEPAVLAFLPLGGLFNAIIAAYTIPIAVAITIAIASRIKVQ